MSRVDQIVNMHRGMQTGEYELPETERDKIPSAWGFVPRNLEKQTFAAIAADVNAHPKFYDEPLKDFEDKLITAARKWARHHDLEWSRVKSYLEGHVWPGLMKNGKLNFTCTKIETESPTLLAWRLEWTGPKSEMPLVATRTKGDNALIDVFPAIAVLFLEENINAEVGRYSNSIFAEELLETPAELFMEAHPFCLISATEGFENEDTVHLPVSFIMDTLAIALDIQTGQCVLRARA